MYTLSAPTSARTQRAYTGINFILIAHHSFLPEERSAGHPRVPTHNADSS